MSSKKERAVFCSKCCRFTRQTYVGRSKKIVQSQIAEGIVTLGLSFLFNAALGELGGPAFWECTKCGHINID